MTILIIANPVSGNYNKDKLEKVRQIFNARFGEVSVILTQYAGHAEIIARQAGEDIIIAAGGDGLINETARGVIGSDKLFFALPFGTANVFCSEYKIGFDPLRAAKKFDINRVININAGYIDDKLFLLMAGFGFDAAAVESVAKGYKHRKFKKLAHVISGVKALFRDKFEPIEVYLSGNRYIIYHTIISLCDSYGGSFSLKNINKNRLNLMMISKPKIYPLLKSIISIAIGRGFVGMRAVCDYVKVSGATACQIDGEFLELEKSSVIIKIKRNALKLVG